MKRFCLTIATICLLLGVNFSVFADINGNGYYRVRNYGTQRWASLIDDKGSIDVNATSADLHALQLMKDTETILSDPGSVVYISNLGGYEYNVAAQGTSVQSLVGYSVFLREDGTDGNGQKLYRIYGTYSGYTKYIADGQLVDTKEYGEATTNVSNINAPRVKWIIMPVDANSDNFFGPVPTLTVNGKMYNPLFTSFAYSPLSAGVKAYYIGRVGYGMAEMIEINGAVPAGTPVIFECAGNKAADNKVKLETLETAVPNNSLRGVYFDYDDPYKPNRTEYNPKTMRILGQCSDGSLGYITADIDYLPANSSYLVVPEGSAPELKCVSTAEYEANLPQSPEQIFAIGSMNDWNFSDGSYNLLPQDDYTYTGTFLIPASTADDKSVSFRFFTALDDDAKYSLGAWADENVVINVSDTTPFTGNFNPGSTSSWTLPDWKGGEVTMSLNLQTLAMKLSFDFSGVKTIGALPGGLRYANGVIRNENGASLSVSNLAGKILIKSSGGSVDLNFLPKGVYMVTSGNQTVKIIK